MKRQVAKLFMNGRSQAVRLPLDFRFDCNEVFIRKDPLTADIIISKKPGSWDDFFKMLDPVTTDFITERDNEIPQERDLF